MHRLRTLGGASLLRDGEPVDTAAAQRKLLALLTLLAMARRRGISRERLAAYLWPESDDERARNALKQSLHVLRRQLGAGSIVGTAELRLNPDQVEADADEFLAAIESGDHVRAVALYAGPFLDGFHLPGAAEFDRWAGEQRAMLAEHYARALAALARAADREGAHADAAALWRRAQAVDPLDARAALGLIEALEAGGERAAALRAAQAHASLVREELGTAPDPAVTAALQRLRSEPELPAGSLPSPGAAAAAEAVAAPASTAPAAASPRVPIPRQPRRTTAPMMLLLMAVIAAGGLSLASQRAETDPANASPADRSIAVLPFANAGGEPAGDPFADGLTGELIGRLGTMPGIRVAGQTSTFALRGRGLDARAIGDTLGVATLLEGTVRRGDERVRITARLLDAKSGAVLWSETFDRDIGDLFVVQAEIARRVARALETGAAPRGADRVAGTPVPPRPTADLEAYDLYLRGRYNWELPTRERLEQGVRYQQRAVERDPAFAAAYAALAETYVNLAVYAFRPPREALARAKVASERALALDPDLVEALVAHAYVLLSELDVAGAESDLRRALALNPSYPWAHHFLSLAMLMAGRPEEAAAHNRQALVLDPLSLPANATRGVAQAQLGNLDSAEAELARARALAPRFTLIVYYLGAVRAAQGSLDSAVEPLRDAARDSPDYPGVAAALAAVERRRGRAGVADSIMAALRLRASDPRAQTNLAFAYGMMGDIDAAFDAMETVQWSVPSLIGLRADPLLAGLRADPRYRTLLQTLLTQRSPSPDAEITPH